jgi:hypothetical protein
MDPRLAIAMAALATSNQTLGAEAARSQNVITRQYAMAALAQGPSPYSAAAVHFDQGVYITIPGPGVNTGQFLFSIWVNNTGGILDPPNDNIYLASYPYNLVEFAQSHVNPPRRHRGTGPSLPNQASFYRVDDRTGFPTRAERTKKEWTA